MDILNTFSTRHTPQQQPASPNQKLNAAGGYTFTVTDTERLRRFLTLGSASGTYYTGAGELTRANAEVVLRMATGTEDTHKALVDTVVDVSQRGAAPKNDYALFALAIAASHGTTNNKQYALAHLADVARTGSHLLQFASYIEQFRGWGRGLRRAVGEWYTRKNPGHLAYQTVKYRNRHGWTHRDLLRLAHPETVSDEHRAVFEWITKNTMTGRVPEMIEGFVKAHEPGAKIVELINRYPLSWEMLPTEALNRRDVWDALIIHGRVPVGALIRQLPRLTRIGLLTPMSAMTHWVGKQIQNPHVLEKGRVHPMNVLVAQRTYAYGQSFRGTGTWDPVPQITDALDAAFYTSFGNVEPAGKRTMLALDVSGSMSFSAINDMPVTPREASAALALVQMATEPDVMTVGFTGGSNTRGNWWGMRQAQGAEAVTPLNISPRQRLDDVIRTVTDLPFGPTDCAAPMLYALENNIAVDTFVVYTDSETYAGRSHPHQALQQYRQKMGIDAKLIVVGMTANDASIADPNDPGMLDIAGFDTSVPNLITEFSKGL